jgi:hypothetical protein
MTIERRKPEKGLTLWQPYMELEEVGWHIEEVFGRLFMLREWKAL